MLEYEYVYECTHVPAGQINKDSNPRLAIVRSISCCLLLVFYPYMATSPYGPRISTVYMSVGIDLQTKGMSVLWDGILQGTLALGI